MSALIRAVCLLEISLACFTISDVYLVTGDNAIGNGETTGLRDTGDIYNPPSEGCNRVPCGLGTNNQPETSRLVVDATSGTKVGLRLHVDDSSLVGKIACEFRYGNHPQFALGTRGFPLGNTLHIDNTNDAPTTTFSITPPYNSNGTIQVFFIVGNSSSNINNTYYQCVDITVIGNSPVPAWAPDFGPSEEANSKADPTHRGAYVCGSDPRCRIYVPKTSDWAWLIILCVLAFLVLCVCLCIAILCCKKQPKTVMAPPPEPPAPHDQEAVVAKEATPSTSRVSPYAHFAFTEANDPPSKKGTESGSTGDRNTGSQGRHFHFHYEEAEPGDGRENRPDVVLRPS